MVSRKNEVKQFEHGKVSVLVPVEELETFALRIGAQRKMRIVSRREKRPQEGNNVKTPRVDDMEAGDSTSCD
eukprot:6299135-Prorocentrum_lima.AAC.1